MNFPRIVSPGHGSAIETASSASYYKLIGIEFAPVNPNAHIDTLVAFGNSSSSSQTDDSQVPHDLILDRCYIHGFPTQEIKRGVGLNSSQTWIINNYISDFHSTGQDSQAIGGSNGNGPFHIINNYLEAAGENILFGGAPPGKTTRVSSDIEILRNYFFKPLSWRSYPWVVMALLELKSARRVMIEGNVFENNWRSTQNGYGAIVMAANIDSGTQAIIDHVTFQYNIVRRAQTGMSILGRCPFL